MTTIRQWVHNTVRYHPWQSLLLIGVLWVILSLLLSALLDPPQRFVMRE
jgi:thiosulfate reductase cytochrome b subunit